MKTRRFFSRLRISYLLVGLTLGLTASVGTSQDDSAPEHSVTIHIGHTSKWDSTCPSPTLQLGNQCILREDVVLTETLELLSDTKLNCQGHKLTPVALGFLDDPRTTASEFQPSHPELAILIHEANSVKIQNCNIEGFDFGILSVNTKNPEVLNSNPPAVEQLSNRILQNIINARTTDLYLIQSDNTLIADNRFTYHSVRGRGVVLEFDSDYNKIAGNTIVSTDIASTGEVRRLPGGPSVIGILDTGIHAVHSLGPEALLNIIVDDRLIQ